MAKCKSGIVGRTGVGGVATGVEMGTMVMLVVIGAGVVTASGVVMTGESVGFFVFKSFAACLSFIFARILSVRVLLVDTAWTGVKNVGLMMDTKSSANIKMVAVVDAIFFMSLLLSFLAYLGIICCK